MNSRTSTTVRVPRSIFADTRAYGLTTVWRSGKLGRKYWGAIELLPESTATDQASLPDLHAHMRRPRFMARVAQRVAAGFRVAAEQRKFARLAATYDFNGYKRVYLVHIRKTGGTSLNNMFLALSGNDAGKLYRQLAETPGRRISNNGLIYVGWNTKLIDQGHYFYGFSHRPLHTLKLPERTFTVSCFRDPARRVISHYNMLMYYRLAGIDHPCMALEGAWLGSSFDDFLDRIPRDHLLNQLHMFSSSFDVEQATANVRGLSHYFFDDGFDDGVKQLNAKTGLALSPVHMRKSTFTSTISSASLARLKSMLADEYRFMDCIRKACLQAGSIMRLVSIPVWIAQFFPELGGAGLFDTSFLLDA